MRSSASVGLYYLEHESLHVTSSSGKVWKVYGSPVSRRSGVSMAGSNFIKAAPMYAAGSFQYTSSKEAQGMSATIMHRQSK